MGGKGYGKQFRRLRALRASHPEGATEPDPPHPTEGLLGWGGTVKKPSPNMNPPL
jgi:hypothetical protein